MRAVLPETVEELWEAVLWIPAGVFWVLIPISCFIFPISWFLQRRAYPIRPETKEVVGQDALGGRTSGEGESLGSSSLPT